MTINIDNQGGKLKIDNQTGLILPNQQPQEGVAIVTPVRVEDLVAFYPFDPQSYPGADANADDATDGLSVAGNSTAFDATVNGATFVPDRGVTDINAGQNSGAFRFDGTDDRLELPGSTVRSDEPFTLSAFVNFDQFPNIRHRIITRFDGSNIGSGDFVLGADPQVLRFTVQGDSSVIQARAGALDTTFSHVAATFDPSSGSLTLHRDGEQVETASGISSVAPGTQQPIGIGGDVPEGNKAEFFDGVMDDVRLYQSKLPNTDIQDIYKNTKPLQIDTLPVRSDDLALYMPFGPGGAVDETAFDDRFGDTTAFHGRVDGATFLESGGVTDINAGADSGAFDFDGVDDQITLDSNLRLGGRNQFTVCLYFAPDTTGGGRNRILCEGSSGLTNNNASLAVHEFDNNTFRVEAYSKSGNISSVQGGTTTIGEYTQVIVTFDNGTAEVFEDGASSIGTFSVGSSELQQSSVDISIGFNAQFDRAFFDGRVDDVRIYNRALSDSEINRIFDNTKP